MNAPGLTQDVYDIIIHAMENGAGLNLAAQAAGFSGWTVRFWMQQAKILVDQGKTRDDDIRIALAEDIPQARAKRAVEALERIREAGKNPQNWTANAWYLERTYPELYGKQDRSPIDWKEQLRKQGVDPVKAMQMLVEQLNQEADEADGEVVDGDIID